MYPKKYLKELEHDSARGARISDGTTAILFLVGFLLLGPLSHELSHAGWLYLTNCFNTLELDFNILSGIYGSVTPYCHLNKAEQIGFYSIGYLSTLLLAAAMNIAGFELAEKTHYHKYLLGLGTGTLLSMLISLNMKGDIENITAVMNLPGPVAGLVTLFLILGIFITSLKSLDMITRDQKGKKDAATRP